MSGLNRRLATNLVWIVVFAAIVTVGAFLTFVTGVLFDDSYPVSVAMPESGGVLPDQEVTVYGRAVGQVDDVEVVEEGVLLTLRIHGDFEVPDTAVAQVLRRSPIGEQAVELRPVEEDWVAAEPDSTIETTETIIPAPVPFLLEGAADLFENLTPDSVGTVVTELSVALEGRGERLRMLNRDSLELQRTLVDGIPEFERLLDTSEAVLAVLRDQREALRSSFGSGADLAEVFAEQRPNLDALLDRGTPALDRTTDLVLANAANLECLMTDMTAINEMLLGPSTYESVDGPNYASKLDEFERALINHRYFFHLGFNIFGQYQPDTGLGWIRVLLVSDEPQEAHEYDDFRPTPVTKPGAACLTDAWGTGVNAVRQANAQPAHETAPGIDYAPRVDDAETAERTGGAEASGPDGRDGAERDTSTRDGATNRSDDGEVSLTSQEEADDGEDPVALDTSAPSADDRENRAATAAGILALIALPGLAGAAWWLRRRESA
jgi:virulence factor Mce-like protein